MERTKSTVIDESIDAADDKTEGFSYLLICLVVFSLAVIFSFGVMKNTSKVAAVQFQSRINPNDAPVSSLVRLPQIGMSRAEKITAYRQANSGEGPVFTCPDDLQKVNGIGPVIAGGLAEYLRFE